MKGGTTSLHKAPKAWTHLKSLGTANLKTVQMTRLKVARRKVERDTCQMALSSGPLWLPSCCSKASISGASTSRLPFLLASLALVCLKGEKKLALGHCNRCPPTHKLIYRTLTPVLWYLEVGLWGGDEIMSGEPS